MKKLFKKSIAMLIAVLMIVSSLPFTALTAQASDSAEKTYVKQNIESFNGYTGTASYTYNGTAVPEEYYSNILYDDKDFQDGKFSSNNNVDIKAFINSNVVLLYDGKNETILPVVADFKKTVNNAGTNQKYFKQIYVKSESTGLNWELKEDWKGNNGTWNAWPTSNNMTVSFSNTNSEIYLGKDTEYQFKNKLYYKAPSNSSAYYESFTPSSNAITFISVHTQWGLGEKNRNTEFTDTNSNIYVVNYKPIADKISDMKTVYNTIQATGEAAYCTDALENFYQAAYKVMDLNPNSYNYSSDVAGTVKTVANDIKNIVDNYLSTATTEPVKHSYGTEESEVTTEPTCIKEGKKTYYKLCTLCGNKVVTKEETIPATGNHNFVYTPNEDGATHTITCSTCDYNKTEAHSFTKSNNFTCVCGYALNADVYNKAVTEADAIVAEKDIYTEASFNAYKTVYDECVADFTVHSQAELDEITNKLISAKTYLVKKTITITFKKAIGDTETTETIKCEYGKEIILDSDITDANITKWTADTDDGTSIMHTSMSSVTYVPYADVTIIVYADSKETFAVKNKKVVFRTLNGSVQEVRYVENFDDVKTEMPDGKEYSFYTFESWGEPKYSADGTTVYYDASYTFKSETDKCGVHFTYDGDRTEDYVYDAYIKLDNVDPSKVYALSTTGNMDGFITNIKGTSFHVPHRDNIYIIVSDKAEEATIGITGNYSTTTTEKRGVAVNAKFCLPEGAVKADAGYDVVMVKTDGTKSASQRIKCPNVNQYNEYTKSFTTTNTSIASFEIIPYVIYTTADGQQHELKGTMQKFTL